MRTGSRSIVANVKKSFSKAQAKAIGDRLGVSWDEIDLEEFCKGLEVEMEHQDVTKGDEVKTAKIALAHLREVGDYYSRLRKYVERGE